MRTCVLSPSRWLVGVRGSGAKSTRIVQSHRGQYMRNLCRAAAVARATRRFVWKWNSIRTTRLFRSLPGTTWESSTKIPGITLRNGNCLFPLLLCARVCVSLIRFVKIGSGERFVEWLYAAVALCVRERSRARKRSRDTRSLCACEWFRCFSFYIVSSVFVLTSV